jgi:hypothetical protein
MNFLGIKWAGDVPRTVSEIVREGEGGGAGVGGGNSNSAPDTGALSTSPTSPSSFSGSSPPSAAASFVSPFRLRRRLRGFFFTSPESSAPSAGSTLSSSSVAGGATGTDTGVGSKGSEEIWTVFSGNIAIAVSTTGDSEWSMCAGLLVGSGSAVAPLWSTPFGTDISAKGKCAFRGDFLLNHSIVPTIDATVRSSAELDGAQEARPSTTDSGTLEIHCHGTAQTFSSPKTSCSFSEYACELVFPGRPSFPVAEGKGGAAGLGTPSSRRAMRDALSALRVRTPV